MRRGHTSCIVRFVLEQLADGCIIEVAVQTPDLLGHAGSPVVDAAGDSGIERRALEGIPVHGIAIDLFLRVKADVLHFGAHTDIVAGQAGRSMRIRSCHACNGLFRVRGYGLSFSSNIVYRAKWPAARLSRPDEKRHRAGDQSCQAKNNVFALRGHIHIEPPGQSEETR